MTTRPANPAFSLADGQRIATELFGLDAQASDLPSYIDRNFRIDAGTAGRMVLRIANELEQPATLDLQNKAMALLAKRQPGLCPEVLASVSGREIEEVTGNDGRQHAVRLVTYLEGLGMPARENCTEATWRSLGEVLARVDKSLADFKHPAMERELRWNLASAAWTLPFSNGFATRQQCDLVQRAQLQFLGQVKRVLPRLPHAVIHNDANDLNLVFEDSPEGPLVSGLFDFGDVVYSARIFELAIAGAYAVFGSSNPLAIIGPLVQGYNTSLALDDLELQVLLPAICMRLAQSVTVSSLDAKLDPGNDHVSTSEAGAWEALDILARIAPQRALEELRRVCGREAVSSNEVDREEIQALRSEHLGPSLSLAYGEPLDVLKGRASYLFDGTGRAYLDGVNNVCHVGHCHPKVVAAGQAQMAELNTNTRYLHPNIVAYARRLTGMFEDPLSVCFFVNSGSEANELALRMARTATGRKDVVTLGGGYHGNTSTLIDISPYKHDGAGGAGAPDWVFSVPCPDSYRGPHRSPERDLATKYASYVESACRKSAQQGTGVAAFLCEPLIGCGGQIVPPAGYLQQCFQHARAAGALCVADEVQIGFGRVGTHWWGFERDGVVPDIVTLGKPMGNGHPLAAVITTPAIAEAFATGMEYFNTFGGNPVSCAIGSAVLDVLEQEDLRAQAQRVGEHLLAGFRSMAERHACLGDVRGAGLYLGVEFVRCRSEREPAADWLAQVIEDVRDGGLLFSSDGPDHNVLKIKPPMTWTLDEAELALQMVEGALNKLASTTTGLGAPDLSLSPAPLEP